MNDYFRNLKKESFLSSYPFGEFKNKLCNKDENITKALLIEDLKCIMILEREKNEYIFIYSDYNGKSNLKIDVEFDKNKFKKFHLINNIIPTVDFKMLYKYFNKYLSLNLRDSFKCEGYQIFSFKNNILLGVLEGPPNTPYENGYFLFKILFPEQYPFPPPKFIFISNIFHPNISENGFVSVDILQNEWTPAINRFRIIIYSIQSLLDDPNPYNFSNERAAKLFREERKIYDKTVSEYTALFANYSKLIEDMEHLNIKIKEVDVFQYLEENN